MIHEGGGGDACNGSIGGFEVQHFLQQIKILKSKIEL